MWLTAAPCDFLNIWMSGENTAQGDSFLFLFFFSLNLLDSIIHRCHSPTWPLWADDGFTGAAPYSATWFWSNHAPGNIVTTFFGHISFIFIHKSLKINSQIPCTRRLGRPDVKQLWLRWQNQHLVNERLLVRFPPVLGMGSHPHQCMNIWITVSCFWQKCLLNVLECKWIHKSWEEEGVECN